MMLSTEKPNADERADEFASVMADNAASAADMFGMMACTRTTRLPGVMES